MILAIDGYEANITHRVGIGRFAHELLIGLAALQTQGKSPFEEVRVYLPDAPIADMPKITARWVYRVVKPKKFWTFVGLPLALSHEKKQADVVFSPTHYIPRFTPIPKVMAIMDLSYLAYPELFRSVDLHKLTQWTAYAAARAKGIITISEYSKSAIIKTYRVDRERVRVVYPGLGGIIRTSHDMTDSVTKDTVDGAYILSVGTLQPRKNFVKLIEAFSKLSDKKIKLIIVGKKGWLYEDILGAPQKYGVPDRVKFLDYISDATLQDLYKKAQCFVLASLYEGFGLPVLEAMSYGVPVVVSNTSSLPEIADEAGIYVEPEDTQSIVAGLTAALSEKGKARTDRINLGKKRVKEFTWEKAATQVMGILEHVGRKGNA